MRVGSTTRERLGLATVASLALHAVVVSGTWLSVPQLPPEGKPLEARIVAPPELRPATARPDARPRRITRPAPPVPEADVPGPRMLPDPELEGDAGDEMAGVETPEPPQQLALAPESSLAIPAHTLPRRGRILFTLHYGDERLYIGKAMQSWEVGADTYMLSSEAETGGLLELIGPQRLRSVSRGRITREGLRPESFLSSRTRRGRNEVAQARFDWEAGQLAFGDSRAPKSAPLTPGAQDLMSFMFQFVLLPPAPGRLRVPITTGTRFEVYELEIRAEEVIETPIGTVRALPVRQLPRARTESIEIWLAAEYRYLPVRIRHFDRDGVFSGEQLVSEIRISEE